MAHYVFQDLQPVQIQQMDAEIVQQGMAVENRLPARRLFVFVFKYLQKKVYQFTRWFSSENFKGQGSGGAPQP
jgi:hypothetical protein